MIQEKLNIIQKELKAPKNQYNSFGNYNYRSCEDILEAVKPLLSKNKCILIMYDEIVNMGDRYYVKATAEFYDTEDKNVIKVSAFARESEEKKGMDSAQITGATSSYARKYALNGLFLIDDTKDADTDEYTKTKEKPQETQKNTELEAFKKDMTYDNYLKLNEADKKRVEIALCKKADVPFMSAEEIKQQLTK